MIKRSLRRRHLALKTKELFSFLTLYHPHPIAFPFSAAALYCYMHKRLHWSPPHWL